MSVWLSIYICADREAKFQIENGRLSNRSERTESGRRLPQTAKEDPRANETLLQRNENRFQQRPRRTQLEEDPLMGNTKKIFQFLHTLQYRTTFIQAKARKVISKKQNTKFVQTKRSRFESLQKEF